MHGMLFIVIPIAWLALITIFVAVCRLAARSDAHVTDEPMPASHDLGAPVISLPGLTVWDCADPIRLRGVADALSAARPAVPVPAARRPNGQAVHGSRLGAMRRHGTRSPARS
ncbi:MAG: hypothetical protein JWO23_1842 [Solirubrobacterales bacterium]|nr:hypothetical protein [Solirubrobacterales bacterium]